MAGLPRKLERVQDTSRWVAMARALESERPDAHFKDPFARALAGDLGRELLDWLSGKSGGSWPIIARTVIIDRLIAEAIREGVDAVLNLAAGLYSRPYRLALPEALTWIEVDHPEVLEHKERILRERAPACRLERRALDLSATEERRTFFASLAGRFRRVLVLTEGLLLYLPEQAALGLARDLRGVPGVFRWITDLNNSAVNEYIARRTNHALTGTARMQFGPDRGPLVFEPLGWRTLSATSLFKTAGRLKRLPFLFSLFARLPEPRYGNPRRPWSGVCVLEPDGSTPPSSPGHSSP